MSAAVTAMPSSPAVPSASSDTTSMAAAVAAAMAAPSTASSPSIPTIVSNNNNIPTTLQSTPSTAPATATTPKTAIAPVTAPTARPDDSLEPPTKRTKRQTLNEAQKHEICIYIREREQQLPRLTNRSVAAWIQSQFNVKVDDSTVSRLRHQAPSRLQSQPTNPTAKRHRQVMFPELERLLGEYVLTCRAEGSAISDVALVGKGRELAKTLQIPADQMTFSDGWLHKFKVRHGIRQPPYSLSTTQSNTTTTTPTAPTTTSTSTTGAVPSKKRGRLPDAVDATPATSTSSSSSASSSLASVTAVTGSSSNANSANESVLAHAANMLTPVDMTSTLLEDIDNDLESPLDPEVAASFAGRSSLKNVTNSAATNGNNASNPDCPTLQMEMLSKAYGTTPPATGSPSDATQQQALLLNRIATDNQSVSAHEQQQQQIAQQEQQQKHQRKPKLPQQGHHRQQQPQLQHHQQQQHQHHQPSQSHSHHELDSTTTAIAGTDLNGTAHGGMVGAATTVAAATMAAAAADMIMRNSNSSSNELAAPFPPTEPIVDFFEAAQCIKTLCSFMQQQAFDESQLENLKDILLTFEVKRSELEERQKRDHAQAQAQVLAHQHQQHLQRHRYQV